MHLFLLIPALLTFLVSSRELSMPRGDDALLPSGDEKNLHICLTCMMTTEEWHSILADPHTKAKVHRWIKKFCDDSIVSVVCRWSLYDIADSVIGVAVNVTANPRKVCTFLHACPKNSPEMAYRDSDLGRRKCTTVHRHFTCSNRPSKIRQSLALFQCEGEDHPIVDILHEHLLCEPSNEE